MVSGCMDCELPDGPESTAQREVLTLARSQGRTPGTGPQTQREREGAQTGVEKIRLSASSPHPLLQVTAWRNGQPDCVPLQEQTRLSEVGFPKVLMSEKYLERLSF